MGAHLISAGPRIKYVSIYGFDCLILVPAVCATVVNRVASLHSQILKPRLPSNLLCKQLFQGKNKCKSILTDWPQKPAEQMNNNESFRNIKYWNDLNCIAWGTFQVWLGTSHEAQEPETLDISRHLLSGSNPVHHEGNPKAKRHEAPTEIVVPTTKSRSGTKSCSNMEDLGRHDQKRVETTRQWPSLNGKRLLESLKVS